MYARSAALSLAAALLLAGASAATPRAGATPWRRMSPSRPAPALADGDAPWFCHDLDCPSFQVRRGGRRHAHAQHRHAPQRAACEAAVLRPVCSARAASESPCSSQAHTTRPRATLPQNNLHTARQEPDRHRHRAAPLPSRCAAAPWQCSTPAACAARPPPAARPQPTAGARSFTRRPRLHPHAAAARFLTPHASPPAAKWVSTKIEGKGYDGAVATGFW